MLSIAELLDKWWKNYGNISHYQSYVQTFSNDKNICYMISRALEDEIDQGIIN